MFVIDVIPFARAAPAGTLSYRSKTALSPGTLVRVTLRRTKIRALVVACESVRDMKSILKRASFTLSSSEPVKDGVLSEMVMSAARTVSEYHAAPVGSTLQALIGEYVQDEESAVIFTSAAAQSTQPKYAGVDEYAVVEACVEQRAEAYRKIISAAMARGEAVHLIAPTIAEILFWKEYLHDLKPIVISGTTPQKNRASLFNRAHGSIGLVITTPGFGWLPMNHRTHYILDRISAGTYRMPKRPYLDLRLAVRTSAETMGIAVTIGDFPVPLEYRPVPSAPLATAPGAFISVIDVRNKEITTSSAAVAADTADRPSFSAFPEALLTQIRTALTEGKRVTVLAVRKGYAPTVVCHDCGQAVVDERGLPLSFTIRNGIRSMRSVDGKTTRIADRLCARCGSWNLVPLGIGLERVEEVLRKEFPETHIIVIDAEKLRTRAHVSKHLVETSSSGTGSIILGTEALLPWLSLVREEFPVYLGVIASADSLLTLPFWRARERLARLILLLASLCERTIVATRHEEDSVFTISDQRTSGAFFTEETALRKALGYPPFGTLIALQFEGSLKQRDSLQADIERALISTSVLFMPDRPLTTTTARRTGIIMIKTNEWPDKALSALLTTLGPSVRVLLDPESLW